MVAAKQAQQPRLMKDLEGDTFPVSVGFTGGGNGKSWQIKDIVSKQYPEITQNILFYMQKVTEYKIELEGIDANKQIFIASSGTKYVRADKIVWQMLIECSELLKEIEDKYHQATGGQSIWANSKARIQIKKKAKPIETPKSVEKPKAETPKPVAVVSPSKPVVEPIDDDDDFFIKGAEERKEDDLLSNDLDEVFG